MIVTTKKGSVEFDGNAVTMRPPKGLGGLISGKSAITVPIRAIRYIEFSTPSGLKAGYFRINTGQPPLSGNAMRPAFMDAVSDSQSIIFTRGDAPSFIALKNAIETALNER